MSEPEHRNQQSCPSDFRAYNSRIELYMDATGDTGVGMVATLAAEMWQNGCISSLAQLEHYFRKLDSTGYTF